MDQTTEEKERILGEFVEVNKTDIEWNDRLRMIKRHFPSVERLDWKLAFRSDPKLLARIINDILKVDAAEPGKPGKRPSLEEGEAQRRLARIQGEVSVAPFWRAFDVLRGDRSIRHTATKTGLNRNRVWKLLKNQDVPTETEMEQIARAFGQEPSYFAEYRLAHVVGFLYSTLAANPEATVGFYHKIKEGSKG